MLILLCQVRLQRLRLPLERTTDEAGDDRMREKLLTVIMNIVPHQVLIEGECPKDTLLLDIPLTLLSESVSDLRKDERYIDTMLITGKGINPLDTYAVGLADIFDEGDIE